MERDEIMAGLGVNDWETVELSYEFKAIPDIERVLDAKCPD